MINTKKSRVGTYAVSLLFIIVGVITAVCIYMSSQLNVQPIDDHDYMVLDSGWTVQVGDSEPMVGQQLPLRLNTTPKDSCVTLTTILPTGTEVSGRNLSVRSGMSEVSVYLDGVLLYSYNDDEMHWKIVPMGGMMPHFITLPQSYPGKMLTIEVNYHSTNPLSQTFHAPLLGSPLSAYLYQMHGEVPSLFFGYSFILIGLICLISSLFLRKNEHCSSLVSFALIEILLGVWVFTQAKSKFVFFRNPQIPMDLSNLALYMLPVILAWYYKVTCDKGKSGRVLMTLSYLFPVTYCIIGIVQFCGLTLYLDMLPLGGGMLVCFLLAMFVVAIVHLVKGNRRYLTFVLAVSVLLLSVVAEEMLMLLGILLPGASVLHFGMGIAGIIFLYGALREVTSSGKDQLRQRMLMDLAYTDSLTGLGNRTRYEEQLLEILLSVHEPMGVFMLDVNNLKETNDMFGHESGDHLLKRFSMKLKEQVPPSSTCFRIGGDEFVAFVYRCTPSKLSALTKQLQNCFSDYNDERVSAAVGSALYIPGSSTSLTEVLVRADDAMYANKAQMKSARKQ